MTILIASTILLHSCMDNDFDLDKVNTDNITLFGDSLIIPLGNTKAISMNEIISDDVLKELGIQKEEKGYSFSFKNDEKIDMDFSFKDDITLKAPSLPNEQTINSGFGSFSLGNLAINANVEQTIIQGNIKIEGQGLNIQDYSFYFQSTLNTPQSKERTTLSLPQIGQSFNPLNNSVADQIAINLNTHTSEASQSIALPYGIAIENFTSFIINGATGGTLNISLVNTESLKAVQDLGWDYSNVRAIFPKEFIVSGDGITINNGRQVKNFSSDGKLNAKLEKIDFGPLGIVPSTIGATEMRFEFGHDGTIKINNPKNIQEISNLGRDPVVRLKIIGSLSNGTITAVSAKTKERTEEFDIDDTEMNLGTTEVPEMIKTLAAISINPVKININVSKLSITGLTTLPSINGTLSIELPDFCRIEGKTVGTDGIWKYSFDDLTKVGFTIPILIDRIANLPPINNGNITFNSQKIKIKGSITIPSFTANNVSRITPSDVQVTTSYSSGVVDSKMTFSQIDGIVENKGRYKIKLDMLKDLREGKGDQSIKLENVSFKNPNLALNFSHTLPVDFKATLTLTPYIADEIKGKQVNIETNLLAGSNKKTIIDNVTEEQVNGLINQLPDSVVLDYTVQAGSINTPVRINMSEIKDINFAADYNVGLPLSFGPDMKISTEGKTDLTLGKEFTDMLFGSEKSKVVLMITAENSIPMNLKLLLTPQDSEGNTITGISISPISFDGGTIVNDKPTSAISKGNIELKGSKESFAKLAKLKYEVSTNASDVKGITIRPDCHLKMSMKLKLIGGIRLL